jgi:RNA polymerase sigma-70 factor (ECF subfamily)
MTIFADDQQLLARFREGEPAALARVYATYAGSVGGLVRRAAPDLRGEVDDLTQEVFSRAFARPTRLSYDARRPYSPYLFSIARHVVADRWRAWRRETPTAWPLIAAAVDRRLALPPPPYLDGPALLERIVSQLPPPLRAVHEERFVRGHSQRAAAVALGVGRQVLRSREAQLKQALRAALEPPPAS